MLPFNLNIPQYSSQAVGTYSQPTANPMSINNIPQFDGYTFDKKSGKYYKAIDPNNVNDLFGSAFGGGGHQYGFTADQLSKMNKGSGSNNFAPVDLPTYTSPEHQYNALANMMTPNDVMAMLTSAGQNSYGAGRFANTAYGGGLLGK